MLKIKFLNSFKKDYKRIVKRGYDIALLENVIRMLADGETLPAKYRDHTLDSNVRRFFVRHPTLYRTSFASEGESRREARRISFCWISRCTAPTA